MRSPVWSFPYMSKVTNVGSLLNSHATANRLHHPLLVCRDRLKCHFYVQRPWTCHPWETSRSFIMAKRKRPSLPKEHFGALLSDVTPSEYEERVSDRSINRLKSESQRRSRSLITNPNANVDVVDGSQALRASPSADAQDERFKIEKAAPEAATQTTANGEADSLKLDDSDSPLSEIPELVSSPEKNHGKSGRKANGLADREAKPAKQPSKSVATTNESQTLDSDAEVNEEADEEEIQAALTRPPPVNSDFLPLPWKGRLGYVSFVDESHYSYLTT